MRPSKTDVNILENRCNARNSYVIDEDRSFTSAQKSKTVASNFENFLLWFPGFWIWMLLIGG
jgi:hypothetical protein